MAAETVVVFDFDLTILDVDSDEWVINEFGATDLFNTLLPTMTWNSLMDRMMKELHVQGHTVEDIAECLKRAPLDQTIKSAIQSTYALGCDLRIVSDANLFFIETILKQHGLFECFTEINTNPNYVDEQQRLRIFPYSDSSHDCCMCPPNMCKGKIIDKIKAIAFAEGKKRLVYLGDGKGDYCPSLKLNEGDYVMPRKNFPMSNLINSNSGLIKAEIHEWGNGEELKRILLRLTDLPITTSDNSLAQLPCTDCKSQTNSTTPSEIPTGPTSIRT